MTYAPPITDRGLCPQGGWKQKPQRSGDQVADEHWSVEHHTPNP